MKFFLMSAFVLMTLMAGGCQNANQTNNNAAAAAKPEKLKIADVVKNFRGAALPLNQIEFYNAATDPEKLLGTPNHYTGKASWQTNEKMIHTIEEFNSDADLQSAKTLIESSFPADKKDFIFTHKNILLRINYQMLPETAAKYEQSLKSM